MITFQENINKIPENNFNYMESLPEELLKVTFSFLEIRDLIVAAAVCKRWKTASSCPSLNSIWESHFVSFLSNLVEALQSEHLKSLESIDSAFIDDDKIEENEKSLYEKGSDFKQSMYETFHTKSRNNLTDVPNPRIVFLETACIAQLTAASTFPHEPSSELSFEISKTSSMLKNLDSSIKIYNEIKSSLVEEEFKLTSADLQCERCELAIQLAQLQGTKEEKQKMKTRNIQNRLLFIQSRKIESKSPNSN